MADILTHNRLVHCRRRRHRLYLPPGFSCESKKVHRCGEGGSAFASEGQPVRHSKCEDQDPSIKGHLERSWRLPRSSVDRVPFCADIDPKLLEYPAYHIWLQSKTSRKIPTLTVQLPVLTLPSSFSTFPEALLAHSWLYYAAGFPTNGTIGLRS